MSEQFCCPLQVDKAAKIKVKIFLSKSIQSVHVQVCSFKTTTYYSFALHFVFSPSDQCSHSTPLPFKQKQRLKYMYNTTEGLQDKV